jgi:type VI protein secretion system component VasK
MPQDIDSLLDRINEFILNPVIVLMFAVALIVFFWGLVEFIAKAGNEEGRSIGKRNMMWGIVGIFIMVAVYGIIKLILSTFGIGPPPYLSL